MYSFKLTLMLTALVLTRFAGADEQVIIPHGSNNGDPQIFGDISFPPFSGMLFAGTAGNSANPADTQNGIALIDPETGTVIFNAPDVQAWGAAADPVNRRILFSVASNSIGSLGGDELFALSYDGGVPESLGVILDPLGEPLRMDGLAVIAGQLYAALDGAPGGGDPDGLYRVDITGKTSEIVSSFTGIGGIDADPVTGLLYGTNDDDETLVQIDVNTGALTELSAYPEDFMDIDALAAGENTLYLVSDEDQAIQVFDLVSNTFTGTLPSPFLKADTFSAATLAYEIPVTREFTPPSIPVFGFWGALLLTGLLLGLGLLTLRRLPSSR